MKSWIRYLCMGTLIFGMAMLWNDGIAKAGPLDLIPGITSLTEEVEGNLAEVTLTAGNMLEQTVETTLDSTFEVPVNLTDGVVELAPVTNAAETVVNGTSDIAEQIGVTVEEAISDTFQVLSDQLASSAEVTACAVKPCLKTESPRLPEVPKTHGEPLPQDSEPVTASKPEPEEDSGDKNDGHSVPYTGIEDKPDRAGAEVVREDDPEPREAPATEMVREVERVADVTVHPEPAKTPDRSSNEEPSPWRNNAIPDAVPVSASKVQTQLSWGHGFHYPKLADAILAEILSMQMSGRQNYAKNSKLLITKRGNEPPTPPPRHSFFSNANEPMRKRSVALVKKNRKVALYAAGSGSAIWDYRSSRY